jgi:hypothetical protein
MAFPTKTLLVTGGTSDADLADQSGAERPLGDGHRLVVLGLEVKRCPRHRDRSTG